MVKQNFVGDIKATPYITNSFLSPPLYLPLYYKLALYNSNPLNYCEDLSILNALTLQVWYMFSPASIQITVSPAFYL